MVWEVKTVTNTTTNQRQIRSGVETSIVEDFSESRNDRMGEKILQERILALFCLFFD